MAKIITKFMVKLPARRQNSRKGDNGRVLVVGGSPEYIGAPALAGVAALRSGADSVVVAAPEKAAWAVNCLSADLVTNKLPGKFLAVRNFPTVLKLSAKADCVVLGGGVSERPESMRLLGKLANTISAYKVLDAAALFAFDPVKLKNAILTPNQKEFERLQKYCNINRLIQNGNIIVAKSHRTKIYAENRIYPHTKLRQNKFYLKKMPKNFNLDSIQNLEKFGVGVYENRAGNPGLTKAGTGDVLAGLIAGFLAQSKDPLQSAINAVYYLGQVGDILLKKHKGYFYLASDLAEEVKFINSI